MLRKRKRMFEKELAILIRDKIRAFENETDIPITECTTHIEETAANIPSEKGDRMAIVSITLDLGL